MFTTRARSLAALALTTGTLTLAGCDDTQASPPPTDAAVTDTPAVTDASAPTDGAVVPYAGPDDWCPGRDHCRNVGDGVLQVGVAREEINPTIVESMWTDLNMDSVWQRNEPFVDTNGNGRFDATWMAGFDNARPATGRRDSLDVRALAFRYNDTTVVVAVLDAVGYFINEMDRIRADPSLVSLGIDKVIIASTHVHEGVDTVGLWGPDQFTSGLNMTYQQLTRARTATAIRRAVEGLRPARMRVAQVVTANAMGSTLDYVNDVRDPVIYDPTVTIVQFTDAQTPAQTIATWVNWAAHPEYTGDHNNLLTADYVHALRTTIEQGIPAERVAGLGGTAVFLNGALGGQVGPSGARPIGADGMPHPRYGTDKADACGLSVARLALMAIRDRGTDEAVTTLAYRTAPIAARTDNIGYHAFYLSGTFDRELTRFDRSRPLGGDNIPWIESRVTYFQLGPVAFISAPGELHPDLWVGARDPRWSWGQPPLTEMANRPDLEQSAQGPFLRDVMLQNPGVRYAFVAGLTEDFLGYIVPRYNYVLHPSAPYVEEADGDHYEETNSIGPSCEEHLFQPMMALARWRPPAQ